MLLNYVSVGKVRFNRIQCRKICFNITKLSKKPIKMIKRTKLNTVKNHKDIKKKYIYKNTMSCGLYKSAIL